MKVVGCSSLVIGKNHVATCALGHPLAQHGNLSQESKANDQGPTTADND
ncbi:MAG: hypothetical protein WB711_00135 [Terriglobales bacterium]